MDARITLFDNVNFSKQNNILQYIHHPLLNMMASVAKHAWLAGKRDLSYTLFSAQLRRMTRGLCAPTCTFSRYNHLASIDICQWVLFLAWSHSVSRLYFIHTFVCGQTPSFRDGCSAIINEAKIKKERKTRADYWMGNSTHLLCCRPPALT